MFRSKELRRYSFCSVATWPGGMYVTPTIAGSRSGAVITGTWAALMKMGKAGFQERARQLLQAASNIRGEIKKIPELRLISEHDSTCVGFTSDKINCVALNDIMSKKHRWTIIYIFQRGTHRTERIMGEGSNFRAMFDYGWCLSQYPALIKYLDFDFNLANPVSSVVEELGEGKCSPIQIKLKQSGLSLSQVENYLEHHKWGLHCTKRYALFLVPQISRKYLWTLNTIQMPLSSHLVVTDANAPHWAEFSHALKDTIAFLVANPEENNRGDAALYGLTEKIPNKGVVGDFLLLYLEAVLDSI